jgi:hypothetical protein
VRFVFLDEGGISQHEPFVVVAGVIVHGDEQLIPLEKELDRLIRKHIPPEQQPGFVFHAKDIWSGIGKIFGDRDKWTLDRRLLILRDLARIPRRLDIPVVHESYERKKLLEDHPNPQHIATAHEISVAAHAVTFASCLLRIEQYMREFYPTEVAQIVAEDNDQARKMLKGVHEGFRYPERTPGIVPNNILPLKHIRGSVHFANKDESGPLQLADLCAFVIRGKLSKHPRNARLYDRLKSMMFRFAAEDENYRGPAITVQPPYVPLIYE